MKSNDVPLGSRKQSIIFQYWTLTWPLTYTEIFVDDICDDTVLHGQIYLCGQWIYSLI